MATKGPTEGKQNPPQNGATLTPGQCKEKILQLIDEEKKALQDLKRTVDDSEDIETQSMLARLALPSKDAVDKILRYETTIERQLYRAMEQLERLQRRRKGEPTIPPITVDVMKAE